MHIGGWLKFDQTIALVKVDILLKVWLIREIFTVDIADDINLARLLARVADVVKALITLKQFYHPSLKGGYLLVGVSYIQWFKSSIEKL